MDRDAIQIGADAVEHTAVPVSDDIEAHLIIEVDGNHLDTLMLEIEAIASLLEEHEGGEVFFAEDAQQKEELWKLRRKVAEAVKLVGQILDVLVFHRIKRITGENRIWLRATGSTLVSQLVDSFIVLFIAFYLGPKLQGDASKQWTLNQVAVTGTGNYIYKFVVAILLTPVIYLVHNWIERYLGFEKAMQMKKAAMGRDEEPQVNIPAAG